MWAIWIRLAAEHRRSDSMLACQIAGAVADIWQAEATAAHAGRHNGFKASVDAVCIRYARESERAQCSSSGSP
jgi:hypothetical protein